MIQEERKERTLRMSGKLSPSGESRPRRIIIADDHLCFRETLRNILSGKYAEFEVVGETADGREAIELCRRLQPDLVLMDVRMPEMDGGTVMATPPWSLTLPAKNGQKYHKNGQKYHIQAPDYASCLITVATNGAGSLPDEVGTSSRAVPLGSGGDLQRGLHRQGRRVLGKGLGADEH